MTDKEREKRVIQEITDNMVPVEGGSFDMGSNEYDNEKPVHKVTVSPFSISRYPVTQAQWKVVMGNNPSYFQGDKLPAGVNNDDLPVESVSWDNVKDFLKKLKEKTGKDFRLPTEAEWEYVARGGKSGDNNQYSGSNNIKEVAWYVDNSDERTHEVGIKMPNKLGIYDMSGNVWEWCNDWYGEYGKGEQTNPTGPSTGSRCVLRGGSWNFNAERCRLASRINYAPDRCYYDRGGFRLVLPQLKRKDGFLLLNRLLSCLL